MRAVQQLKAPHVSFVFVYFWTRNEIWHLFQLLSVDEMPLDLNIDLSRYSREAIVEYIDFLYSLIDQEINVRLKLEQSVTSLSNHIKLLSDNINMRMKQRGLIW